MTLPQAGFSVHNLKMEPAEDTPSQAQFVKPEDIERPFDSHSSNASSPSPSQFDTSDISKQTTSKPVKKRKSWGQELPEPTTNLPPRKRAKTEAEREQRRIERVKRNRQAAHNSRERKRHEHDIILSEKNKLVNECNRLRAQLAEANNQIALLTGGKVQVVPEVVLQPTIDMSASSPTSYRESSIPSFSTSNNTPLLTDLTSPRSDCTPYTPVLADSLDLDTTQQPAALLCDQQCRSMVNTCQLIQRELTLAVLSTIWTTALNSWICSSKTRPRTSCSLTINTMQPPPRTQNYLLSI